MSEKYLGEEFDIHGGGMDLQFPHHECELAQNTASRGKGGVRYWMHNNLLTVNGQKMGKSLGNFTTLADLYKVYSPMTIRFFILQAHYRGTLDFSNEALSAAEKGLRRVLQAAKDYKVLPHGGDTVNPEIEKLPEEVVAALCDDLNTPVALAQVFDAVRIVNQAKDGSIKLSDKDYESLSELFGKIVPDVLGLVDEVSASSEEKTLEGLMEMILEVRREAKARKDFATSDSIRDRLKSVSPSRTQRRVPNGACSEKILGQDPGGISGSSLCNAPGTCADDSHGTFSSGVGPAQLRFRYGSSGTGYRDCRSLRQG